MSEAASADRSIVGRMVRAARLEEAVYEEVEHDEEATAQAAIVVVGTSIAAGIGSIATTGIAGLIVVPLFALLGWAVYAYLAYLVGTNLLAADQTRASWSEVARTVGFAAAPRALLIFTIVPVLGGLVALVVAIWVLVTTVVAVRAALDFSTGRAIGTAIIAWIAQAVIFAIPYAILGG